MGHLWSEYGARTEFKSPGDLNAYLNQWLGLRNQSIDLTNQKLVFCHLGLCRRNMIMLPDRSICLLDFAHAGLYPRVFELVSCRFVCPDDPPYTGPYRELLTKQFCLSAEEENLYKLVNNAGVVNLRWPNALEVPRIRPKCRVKSFKLDANPPIK